MDYKTALRKIGTIGDAVEFSIKEAGLTKSFVASEIKEDVSNFNKMLNGTVRKLSIEQLILIITIVKNTVITDWINMRSGIDPLSPISNLGLRQDRYDSELAALKAKLQHQEERDQAFKELLTSYLDKS